MTAWIVATLSASAVWLAGLATVRERRQRRLAEIVPVIQEHIPSTRSHPRLRTNLVQLRRPGRRADVIQVQLADAISAIASASRAGMSLPQALELAGEQAPEPIGSPLRGVVHRVRLGSPVEDALEGWVAAMPVPDVRLAVGVLRLHRAVGGMLAPTLDGLARTLRERRAAVREIRSLTAQARLSGAILGLLPVGFFAFLWLASRGDMLLAVGSQAGRTAIAVGLGLDLVAFVWIRRMLRVDA